MTGDSLITDRTLKFGARLIYPQSLMVFDSMPPDPYMWIGWPASPKLEEFVGELDGIDSVIDNLIERGYKGIILGPWNAFENQEGKFQYGPFDSEKRYRNSLNEKIGSKSKKTKFYHAFDPTPEYYQATSLVPLELDPSYPHKNKKNVAKQYFRKIIERAEEKGLQTYYLLVAVCPVGDYAPKGMLETTDVNGNKQNFGCLNTPGLPKYLEGVLRDVLDAYPELDGVVLDHLEFPSYTIDETFGCFCDGCYSKADSLGYDLDKIKQSVLEFRSWIRKKGNIKKIAEDGITSMDVIGRLFSDGELSNWFQFKFKSANELAKKIQQTVQKLDPTLELHIDSVNPSFCPISGTDVRGLNKYCDIVNPKLYPTAGYWGWHNRLGDYAEFILKKNDLKESTVVRFLEELFGLEGMSDFESVNDLREKPFPVEFFRHETQKAVDWVGDGERIRPWVWIDNEEIDEIRNIFRGISEVNVEGVFVKQYSSATEEKLNIIQEEFGL